MVWLERAQGQGRAGSFAGPLAGLLFDVVGVKDAVGHGNGVAVSVDQRLGGADPPQARLQAELLRQRVNVQPLEQCPADPFPGCSLLQSPFPLTVDRKEIEKSQPVTVWS